MPKSAARHDIRLSLDVALRMNDKTIPTDTHADRFSRF